MRTLTEWSQLKRIPLEVRGQFGGNLKKHFHVDFSRFLPTGALHAHATCCDFVEVFLRLATFICWRLPSLVRGRQICLWVCVVGAPYTWKLASRAASVQLGCLFVFKSMSGITWMCTNRMSGCAKRLNFATRRMGRNDLLRKKRMQGVQSPQKLIQIDNKRKVVSISDILKIQRALTEAFQC